LYERAKKFLEQAEEIISTNPAVVDSEITELLGELRPTLLGGHSRVNALGFLHASESTEDVRKKLDHLQVSSENVLKKALLERQNEYSSGSVEGLHELVALPPQMQPIACKPLLFDIAFDELQMPDLQDRMLTPEEKAKANAPAATGVGGLLSWLRG